MIELEHVSRVFVVGGRPVRALDDVTLTIPDGSYVSVMGPSGSGKSTLLHIVGCLDRPTYGAYRLDGRAVAELSETELSRVRGRRIGFVFQTFHLVPRLSALENVELPMLFAGVPSGERRARAARALDAVGLAPRARHRPEQLSGGERQRVAVARAVVMGPSILLADEPTGNLDTASGREVVALLEGLNASGLTLIVVTHDGAIGERARRRVRFVDGAVVSDSAPVPPRARDSGEHAPRTGVSAPRPAAPAQTAAAGR